MNKALGVAIGSQELKVLCFNGASENAVDETEKEMDAYTDEVASDHAENAVDDGESKKDDNVLVLPYNEAGLEEILRIAKEDNISTIILAGNRLWAKPIAYGLARNEMGVRYVAPRKAERGGVLSQVKFLKNALERGVTGKPFFGERYKNNGSSSNKEEVAHPWLEVAMRGAKIDDDLRRAKHRILNQLRLIFPELITLEQKIWGKKSIAALAERRFGYFSHYGLDYAKSLARYIPISETHGAREALTGLLAELSAIEARKEEYESEVNRLTQDHPILKMFEGSESAKKLTLLIGWRKWGRTKNDFRQLRKYAGLAVSRIDSKGNPRISRERPQIRVNLYFLLRTGVGKQILAEASERLGRDLKKRPKRMEIVLKQIWKNCLQET